MSTDVKGLLKYRSKSVSSLDNASWTATCSECEAVKPMKTRHCSVCNRCIFHLDHHSPWVNNCIGLENQRFYLLFIFYSWLGLCYNLVSMMAIWNHYIYREHLNLMNFMFVMDCLLLFLLTMINIWHWALAMTGISTVDILTGTKVIYTS
jgi:DHHC palmitoyltransferase